MQVRDVRLDIRKRVGDEVESKCSFENDMNSFSYQVSNSNK
jgi:hypothetical protein